MAKSKKQPEVKSIKTSGKGVKPVKAAKPAKPAVKNWDNEQLWMALDKLKTGDHLERVHGRVREAIANGDKMVRLPTWTVAALSIMWQDQQRKQDKADKLSKRGASDV